MMRKPVEYRTVDKLIVGHLADHLEAYVVPARKDTRRLVVIASVDEGWEHVSVRAEKHGRAHTPTWDEMCIVKDLFWDDEDEVIQIHPRKSEYVNRHKHVLHLWRHPDMVIPR